MMLAIGAMGITLTDVGIPEKNETSCLISNITKNETGTGVELSALVRVVSLISLLLYVSCYAFSFGPGIHRFLTNNYFSRDVFS